MPDFKQEPIAPIQFANPVEQYQNILKTQYLASEIAKAQREEDDSTALNNAGKVPGAFNADGTPNIGIMTNHLASIGQAKSIAPLQQKFAQVNQTNAKAGLDAAQGGKADIEAQLKTMEYFRDRYKSIDPNSPDAPAQAYQVFKEEATNPLLAKLAAANGVTPPQHIQQRVAEMQPHAQDPQSLGDWFTKQSMSAKDAAAALEQKKLVVDGGDHNDIYTVGKQGNMVKDLTTPRKMADHSVRVTVSANQQAASALAKQLGEDTGKMYTALDETAQAAPQSVADTDRIVGMIASGKVIMGALSDAKLEALRHEKALAGKLSPENEELLNNSQEVKKYMTSKLLSNIAALNKAGLGARTNLVLTKLEQESAANGTMEPMAALKILLNQRKAVQDAIPRLNELRKGLANSPDKDVRQVMQTLVKNELPPIPDHPLYQTLVGGPGLPPGAPASPQGKTYPSPTPAAVQLLRSGRISKETFEDEAHYGKGSAARALSGK